MLIGTCCTLPDGLMGTPDGPLGALVTLMPCELLIALIDGTSGELFVGEMLWELISDILGAAEGVIMNDITVEAIMSEKSGIIVKAYSKNSIFKIPGHWIGGILNSPQHPSPGIFRYLQNECKCRH